MSQNFVHILFLSLLCLAFIHWTVSLGVLILSLLVLKAKIPPNHIPVDPRDLLWSWNGSKNPHVIVGLMVFEKISFDAFKDGYRDRMIDSSPLYWKFKKMLVKKGGINFWIDDPNYSIDRHIMKVSSFTHVATKAQVADYLSELAPLPLPMDKPLWELRVIENYEGDKTAVICRFHHVIADGIALTSVIFHGMNVSQHGEVQSLTKVGRSWQWKKILALAFALPQFLRLFLLPKDGLPLCGKPLSCERKIFWSDRFSLDDVKKIKNHYKCSVNDVLTSCVSGAFYRELLRQFDGDLSKLKGKTLKAIVPMNTRSSHKMVPGKMDLSNSITTLFLFLSIDSTNPIDRLKETHRNMTKLKTSAVPFIQDFFLVNCLRLIPFEYLIHLIDWAACKCTVVFTNVPGPHEMVGFKDCHLIELIPWVPLAGDLGWGVSVMSYAGSVQVGLNVDSSYCKEPERVIDGFFEEFSFLLESVEKGKQE